MPSMGKNSDLHPDPALNEACTDELEHVIEPNPSMNTCLLTASFQTSLAMLKRELRADMQALEGRLRREIRRQDAHLLARLEREVTPLAVVQKAPVAHSSSLGTSCTPRVGPIKDTVPPQPQKHQRGTTPTAGQLDRASVDALEHVRGVPETVQFKKVQGATTLHIDFASVDAEQRLWRSLTHYSHSSQASSSCVEQKLRGASEASFSSAQSLQSVQSRPMMQREASGLMRIPETSQPKFVDSQITGSRGVIRGSFFNFQHRAYDAVKNLELSASRPARMLRCVHCSAMALFALWMVAFMSWGIFKVANSTRYAEIHREEREWVSGSMPLPPVGFNVMDNSFSATIHKCSIERGNYSTKHCEEVKGNPCNLGAWRRHMMCFPSGLRVAGTFGDPLYSYVVLHVFSGQTSPITDRNINLEVAWEQHVTLFNKVNMQQLYTGACGRPVAHELFFQKVLSIVGSPVGFAGRQGNDESEELLASEKVLSKAHEYTRLSYNVDENAALSMYFRASMTHREDFYESYSVLRLLESIGGLWTSLTAIISILTLTLAVAYAKLTRCYKLGKLQLNV